MSVVPTTRQGICVCRHGAVDPPLLVLEDHLVGELLLAVLALDDDQELGVVAAVHADAGRVAGRRRDVGDEVSITWRKPSSSTCSWKPAEAKLSAAA